MDRDHRSAVGAAQHATYRHKGSEATEEISKKGHDWAECEYRGLVGIGLVFARKGARFRIGVVSVGSVCFRDTRLSSVQRSR
jgi:hypothetical protein